MVGLCWTVFSRCSLRQAAFSHYKVYLIYSLVSSLCNPRLVHNYFSTLCNPWLVHNYFLRFGWIPWQQLHALHKKIICLFKGLQFCWVSHNGLWDIFPRFCWSIIKHCSLYCFWFILIQVVNEKTMLPKVCILWHINMSFTLKFSNEICNTFIFENAPYPENCVPIHEMVDQPGARFEGQMYPPASPRSACWP